VRTVFLDTVGLLAVWDESDQWHAAAQVAFEQLEAQRASFITTSLVLAETANAAARRPYRAAVVRLREQMESAGWVIYPTPDDWSAAWTAYARSDAAGAGLVDHISIIVMRRSNVTEIFTNDSHFRAAGLITLF